MRESLGCPLESLERKEGTAETDGESINSFHRLGKTTQALRNPQAIFVCSPINPILEAYTRKGWAVTSKSYDLRIDLKLT